MANWNFAGSGNWTDTSKWDAAVPNGIGAIASFSGATTTRTIDINSTPAIIVGTLQLLAGGGANDG